MTDAEFNWLQWRAEHEFLALSDDEVRTWLSEASVRGEKENEDRYLVMAGDLMLAGWTAVPLNPKDAMMSWKWRRPGPRGGRLFHSTDQAFNALERHAR